MFAQNTWEQQFFQEHERVVKLVFLMLDPNHTNGPLGQVCCAAVSFFNGASSKLNANAHAQTISRSGQYIDY